MSKLSIIGILFILLAVGVFASRKCSHIVGSGIVTTETREVKRFKKLQLDGVFKTIITQDGGAEWVKVEADKNLQQTITASNEGETLVIRQKSNTHMPAAEKTTVYVNVRDIDELINDAVGAVETKGRITTQDFMLKTEAVGKTKLDINAAKLIADLNGVGVVALSGKVANVSINNNGVGKLEAYDLKADTLDLENNGVGAAEVFASTELSINQNGVGAVHYKGGATVKKMTDEGVGKVSKAD